jgi:hypothetical protein
MFIHLDGMGMMEVALCAYHPSTSSRVVVDGGKLDLTLELLVIRFRVCIRGRTGSTSRQRLGERDDFSVLPYSFIAVESRD